VNNSTADNCNTDSANKNADGSTGSNKKGSEDRRTLKNKKRRRRN